MKVWSGCHAKLGKTEKCPLHACTLSDMWICQWIIFWKDHSFRVHQLGWVKGSRLRHPKMEHLACGSFRAEDNQDPVESGKAFYLPNNCLKEFGKGASTGETAISRDNIFIWDTCLHGLANMYSPNISSFHFPVNCFPPLWSPRPPFLFLAQDGI